VEEEAEKELNDPCPPENDSNAGGGYDPTISAKSKSCFSHTSYFNKNNNRNNNSKINVNL